MSSLYSRYVLPRILDLMMKDEALQSLRAPTVMEARGRILEIGFGSGMNMAAYPTAVKEIAAIDPSIELYALAKNRVAQSGIHVHFVSGTAENLPFTDSQLDTVVSTWSLCSMPDARKALEEAFRVLKPGGVLLYVEHELSSDAPWQKWQKRLTPFWKRLAGGCCLDRPIDSLIKQTGFLLVKYTDFDFEDRKKKILHLYQGMAVKPGA